MVPISTGGGKALYVGTFLPADGEYQRVKALLAKRYLHRDLAPNSAALERVDPTPLFDRVAARYPDLPRDSALGKIGKQNFSHYFGEDPARLPGDDRAQGRADVEQRDRRSDEQHRRARDPAPDRRPRAGRARRCSAGGAGGGS